MMRKSKRREAKEGLPQFLGADKDLVGAVEMLKDRLYLATYRSRGTHHNTAQTHYFSIDQELVYRNFYSDFGPLNLACLYRYCTTVHSKLNSPALVHKKIIHWTTVDPAKRANAAYLITSYAVIYLGMSPQTAIKPLLGTKLMPFQDAITGHSAYHITITDCLNALKKATFFGLVNFDDFDLHDYEHYERIQNGDINWIVPQKFLAFPGPVSEFNNFYHAPEFYVDYFLRNDVRTVIRLNAKCYDARKFLEAGINHVDLFFIDGGVPTRDLVRRFLDICEETPSAIAVHCKAGLGRTGSLIGAYLVKHYHMTALEAIAWLRICRPGSIIGQQQAWLEGMEQVLWRLGESFRLKTYGGTDRIKHHSVGIYSIKSKLKTLSSLSLLSPDLESVDNSSIIQKVNSKLIKPLTNVDMGKGSKFIQPTNAPRSNKTIKLNGSVVKSQTQGDRLNAVKCAHYKLENESNRSKGC